ncbi:hypothetical protein BASA83_010122 [Batrachochytrium salamandrivorans]|nr:hypothetical protein BASA83_010122 [Batrachochytrium salamandrivorans]
MLENTVSSNSLPYTKEPRVCLPDKFDGTRKHFRGFINQLELVFQLQSDRYNTDQKMIATLGTLLTGNALAWYNPYLEKPPLRVRPLSLAEAGKSIAPSMWLISSINSRSRLERLRPSSPILLWTQLRDQGCLGPLRYSFHSFLGNPQQSKSTIDFTSVDLNGLRTSNTSWNQTPRRPPPPSPMVVPPPRSSNDMDIDFARRGPLTSEERQQRMSRGLCLVCGQSGHLKANCPKSNPNFRAPNQLGLSKLMMLTLKVRETIPAVFK